MKPDNRGALEARLYQLIPLTQALGVRVVEYEPGHMVLSAPLAPNHNHQGTAFGGSLYSVAVTAAWGALQFWLEEHGIRASTLIQSGSMDYLFPVDGNFVARCNLPGDKDMSRVERALAKYGRGRLPLSVEVVTEERLVATFGGRFVVVRN